MPLLSVSPNIQELESVTSRKRTRDEYADSCLDESAGPDILDEKKQLPNLTTSTAPHGSFLSPHPVTSTQSPPTQSSPAALTDASSSTPTRNSPSPNTPTRAPTMPLTPSAPASSGQPQLDAQSSSATKHMVAPAAQPAAKRKKLTAEEKEKKAKEEAAKKKEKEEARAAKAAEKAKHEAEKKARQEERDKKKREKEEEERRIQEDKEKKARSQTKLGSFFKIGPSTPKKDTAASAKDAAPRAESPSPAKRAQEHVSGYDKMFKPFFIKDQVTLAANPFAMDDATKAAKSRILDEYLRGERDRFNPMPFNPVTSLHLPPLAPLRGRTYPSVRKVMAEYDGSLSSKPIDLTTESQNTQIRHARKLLRRVPMKYLCFREDVRPAYFGTITSAPNSRSLRKLARMPTARDVLPLQYDYDSEAEWQDDGDGEDIDMMDDDDEDLDEEEEMGDFLDDSEDAGPARALFSAGMEPESTGLAFENRQRLGPLPHMYKYRMEFILNTLDHHAEIDPFSSKYWEPEPKPSTTTAAPASKSASKPATAGAHSNGASSTMAPPPTPADALAALTAGPKADSKKAVVPAELLSDFKAVVLEFPGLSKLGLVEILSSKLPKCTKAQVRNTLDLVAERSNKVWRLKADS